MGQKGSTQPGVVYKLPDLPEEHQHLLTKLPKHYLQTELFPEEAHLSSKRPELLQQPSSEKTPKQYLKGDLEALEHTEILEPNVVKHIFNGEVKESSAGKGRKRLEATGYHTEVIKNAEGKIIPGTKSSPDKNGIYRGRVTVNGVRKRTNNGLSTFFPENWSPQHIINSINHAYTTRKALNASGSICFVTSKEGIKMKMRINPNGKIASVYPIMEES